MCDTSDDWEVVQESRIYLELGLGALRRWVSACYDEHLRDAHLEDTIQFGLSEVGRR